MLKVGTYHPSYIALMEAWKLPLALSQGTRAMREHANEFLPRFPRETPGGHEARVKTSTLYNAFKRTLRVLCAKPFSKDVKVVQVPKDLEIVVNDTDRRGQTLTQYCKIALSDMLTFGLVHTLVDMPKYEGSLSRADEVTLNVHPYFCRVRPDALVNWQFVEGLDGTMILDEIHIRSELCDQEGDSFVKIQVWTRESIQDWRRKKNPKEGESADFALHSDAPNPIGVVPLHTIYADVSKEDDMMASSPLDDLAWLNLHHFQSQSDQTTCLHYARVPFLHFAGFAPEEVSAVIAVDNAFITRNHESSIKWVEPTGNALEQGFKDLEQTEARMDVMGADLMVQKPGNPTATAKSIDTAEKVSDLQSMVINLEQGCEELVHIAGLWYGVDVEDGETEVQINKQFGLSLSDKTELDLLLKARLSGEISRELFYTELLRRGVFDEFDVEEELNRVALENKANAQTGVPTNG